MPSQSDSSCSIGPVGSIDGLTISSSSEGKDMSSMKNEVYIDLTPELLIESSIVTLSPLI